MKKTLFIVVPILIGVVALLVLLGARTKKKQFINNLSFQQTQNIPYGTRATVTLLQDLKKGVTLNRGTENPFSGSMLSGYNKTVIFYSMDMEAASWELNQLTSFVRDGNDVWFISNGLSSDLLDYFELEMKYGGDSIHRARLSPPYFNDNTVYSFPSEDYLGQYDISVRDPEISRVISTDENGSPLCLQFSLGEGHIYIHTNPMLFTNYFALYKNNDQYLASLFSLIPEDTETIEWNEYYRTKQNENNDNEPNWLRVLLKYESFRWAFYLALLGIILAVFFSLRRSQRMIPAKPPLRNDSLEFVKTMGRLYFSRGDHVNLAQKMGAYFLEHVRTRYKMNTSELDEEFVKELGLRSGYSTESLKQIVEMIQHLPSMPGLTERQLFHFHHNLEKFYQQT